MFPLGHALSRDFSACLRHFAVIWMNVSGESAPPSADLPWSGRPVVFSRTSRRFPRQQVAIVVLGNKIDLSEQRQVDAEVAQQWARSEKVRLWEVTVTDRKTLIEPFTLLASKLSQPQSKSSFPLPGRKNKGNSSSEN